MSPGQSSPPPSPKSSGFMAAARDVSFYRSGGSSRSAYAFHIVKPEGRDAGHVSACNIPILHDEAVPAEEIPKHARCGRPGCRSRWRVVDMAGD